MIFNIPNFYPDAGIFQVYIDNPINNWPKKIQNKNFVVVYKMSIPNITVNNERNYLGRMLIYFDFTKCTISNDNGLVDFKVSPFHFKEFFLAWKKYMIGDEEEEEFIEEFNEGIAILNAQIIKLRTTMSNIVQTKLSKAAGYEFEPHPSNPINRRIAEYAGLKSPGSPKSPRGGRSRHRKRLRPIFKN